MDPSPRPSLASQAADLAAVTHALLRTGDVPAAPDPGILGSVLGAAVERAYDGIMITDAELVSPGPRILYVNAAVERISGYPREELLGKTPRILQGPGTEREVTTRLVTDLREKGTFLGQAINYRKDGTPFVMEWSISAIPGASPHTAAFYVAVQRDVTAFRRVLEDAAKAGLEDPLTGFGNRRTLEIQLASSRAEGTELGALMIDVDRLKAINDTHGHFVGDEVLREAASRIRDVLREGDKAVRFGGDEFCVLLPGVQTTETLARVAGRIREAVARTPVDTGAGPLRVTVSVGAATSRAMAADPIAALASADAALLQAKAGGRDQVRVSAP